MHPDDAKRIQDILDIANRSVAVDLIYDPKRRKVTWGCAHCGATPVLLSDKCSGGSYFPGNRCKDKENEL